MKSPRNAKKVAVTGFEERSAGVGAGERRFERRAALHNAAQKAAQNEIGRFVNLVVSRVGRDVAVNQ